MDLQTASFTRPTPSPIKNITKAEKLRLSELLEYQEAQVVSRTLAQNKQLSLTLFAFAKGEGLSTHSSTGDAMVQVLDGLGQFTIAERTHQLSAGECIVLPANIPHAVDALEDFKMLLTVVK